ncbi:MAG: hypothetical protein EA408_05745 [Marinilabiliales bacterium]|nr:MAG: hypothetical protein EA408_05745 [Marinilabiliales bacterium]
MGRKPVRIASDSFPPGPFLKKERRHESKDNKRFRAANPHERTLTRFERKIINFIKSFYYEKVKKIRNLTREDYEK